MIRFPFLLWCFGSLLIAYFILHSYCSKSSLDDVNMWVDQLNISHISDINYEMIYNLITYMYILIKVFFSIKN
jgi:hypothetical protein